ncbi:hypothetical protein [Fluviicola sp.]|jgi:hypothetical protein|uniref:hypothetical protein n=1 Tax=Fluviicola sp. TaxID=1917219 RepID=UPI0028290F14|nr:hypothetical protein [Fluviicola sp.]MDR0801132.1 hypothetical protein [Fluviicola sp.]
MKGKAILFFLGFCLMLSACKKEIGKKEYTMTFRFESGDEISLTGKIYEKNKKSPAKQQDFHALSEMNLICSQPSIC